MTPRPSVNAFSRSLPYVCRSCVYRRSIAKTGQRRSITREYLRKTAEAEAQWKVQEGEIREGKRDSMLTILEKRGYVNSIAGERKSLDDLMNQKRIGAYVGIDPTAPSMHVGHLVPFMSLFWLHVHGFRTVSLLGGATAKIGDPTGRTVTREKEGSSVRKANMASMHFQLKKLWANVERHAVKYGYKWEWAWRRELANNNAWFNKLPMLDVLKVLGPGVRIGTMLGRDTVRNKMEKGDGLSFAEFTYPIMQAWDWWYMYETKHVQLQIGGSDQFGNIVAGIDAINYVRKTHPDPDIRQEKDDPLMKPVGFTVPLLTTASGEKFGKSAGNAIWLNGEMTSPFELHQFFFRTADADVGRYLRLFTFIPLPEIDDIMAAQAAAPSKRPAQRRLARDVIELIHGVNEANAVESQAEVLFGPSRASIPDSTDSPNPTNATENTRGNPKNTNINSSLNRYAPQVHQNNAPEAHITLPRSLIDNRPIARILYAAGLVSSYSEGNRLASKGGAYIGSRPGGGGDMPDQVDFVSVKNWFPEEIQKFIIDGELLILRVGKWKVKVVKIVSDEKFEEMGGTAPGWEEMKAEMELKVLSEKMQEVEGQNAEQTVKLGERVQEDENPTGMRKAVEKNGKDEERGEEPILEKTATLKKKLTKHPKVLPKWKTMVTKKHEMTRREEVEAKMAKLKEVNDADWKDAGYGIGKRFKVPKYKLTKYFDSRKPPDKPVKIRKLRKYSDGREPPDKPVKIRKFNKYSDGREPPDKPVKIRYHMSEEGLD